MDSLTLEAALPVIESIGSDNTILVGGQAINVWAAYLGVDISSPYLTRDIDVLGTKQDALKAFEKLPGKPELILGTMDSGINSAVIKMTFPGESEERIIDFLIQIYGLDPKKMDAAALVIEFEGVQIRIIHPLHLMQSKISNLNLEVKQTQEGLAQADASIAILNAFLVEMMAIPENDSRDVLKVIKRITDFATEDFAVAAYKTHRIEILNAIPIAAFRVSGNEKLLRYVEKDFPARVRYIEKFRR